MSRVQLALNVDDLDEAVAFYSKLFGAEPAKVAPATPTSPSPSPRSSSCCWRTRARVARSTTSASRSPTPTPSTPNRLASPIDGPRLDRRARHHLLLRQAGQVLGPGRTQR